MAEDANAQPSPKTPLPAPASYTSEPAGENPERPLEIGTGIVSVAIPSAGFAENDSPTPRTALPPRPSGCDASHPAADGARPLRSPPGPRPRPPFPSQAVVARSPIVGSRAVDFNSR